ncbi:MAG: hypothetical protein OXC48_08865, partial [Endozoicomonadaceae bacterium]|nr:hypothetical protein [Endozoicomonadaceae bacterium]
IFIIQPKTPNQNLCIKDSPQSGWFGPLSVQRVCPCRRANLIPAFAEITSFHKHNFMAYGLWLMVYGFNSFYHISPLSLLDILVTFFHTRANI